MNAMLKLLVAIVLFVNGAKSDKQEVEMVLDKIASQIIQIGDPTHLYEEDPAKLKEHCEKYEEIVLNKEKHRILALFNGMMYKIGKSLLPQLTKDEREACVLLKNGEGEKAIRIAKNVNAKLNEAKGLRCGFQTVLHEASQKNTKTTFADLICYLRKFCNALVQLYSDNEEAKKSIEKSNNGIWVKIIAVLEEETGKGKDNCELPPAGSNPSKYNSVMLPLLKAIDNLETLAIEGFTPNESSKKIQ